MKTNFTMTKRFLFAIALLTIVVSSCKKEEEVVPIDISGMYSLQSATLIDGNVDDADAASNLLISDGLYLLGLQGDVDVPTGEATITSGFVDAVLRGAAPCTNVDPRTWTYNIDLQSGGDVAFVCTSENDLSETLGTYRLLENNTTLSMSISVSFSPIPITITITELEVTETTITGKVERFPMLKHGFYDLATGTLMPIGAPIDGDATNLVPDNLNVQYLSATIVLTK